MQERDISIMSCRTDPKGQGRSHKVWSKGGEWNDTNVKFTLIKISFLYLLSTE